MMGMFKKRGKGFTLAEVLITLGIIGVVAALTIPTLMANYQKVQEVAGLKKAYAEITEALRLMANDHGCADDLKCTGAFNGGDNVTMGTEFKKYLKVAKDCANTSYNPTDDSTKCFSDSVSWYYDGSNGRSDFNYNVYGKYRFITADGFAISLASESSWNTPCGFNLAVNNGIHAPNLNINQVCGEMWVDVNGFKGPNNFGRDIFYFTMTNGRGPAFYPYGGHEWLSTAESEYWAYKCNSNWQAGMYCAARIMEEGWQMKY